jgi:hypothetical protein
VERKEWNKMKKKISFVYNLTDEYCTIGICSHLKDYKLCWNLNKTLNINLSKYEDFSKSGKNSTKEKYSFFYYNDQNNRNTIFLLTNKNNNISLFDKIPEADYLLLIKGQIASKKIEELIFSLKKTSNILTVFLVNLEKIKEANGFLTEIELHEMSVIKKA